MRPPFDERYQAALVDPNIRHGLEKFQGSWRISRDDAIADLEAETEQTFLDLRTQLAAAKQAARDNLEQVTQTFCENARRAGSTVIFAATIQDALNEITQICARHDASLMVKGKSMVSEELDLNKALEGHGITAIETDLGEWLLQLSHDHPSHLVMPIIHRRRHQIASLLESVLHRPFDPDDIPTMVATVRTELRKSFVTAHVGLSGANALVASTGSIMLVTNEGNNRMATSLPPVHIVLAGIDKLVPDTRAALAQIRLLGRSATGQTLTTYTTFIAGPTDHQHQYIILIDNGRLEMLADPEFESALGCIRCGACANVCPPYSIVGGHAFGYVYTGAIGLVNTAFHHGIDAVAGPQSLCVSCGACTAVCPAEIPLAEQILKTRARVASSPNGRSHLRRLSLRLFSHRRIVATGTTLAAITTRPLVKAGHLRLARPARQLGWRRVPRIPIRPARSLLRAAYPSRLDERSAEVVTLFIQCVTDRVAPEIAIAAARLIEATGAQLEVPRRQHCCGLPALDSGERDLAIAMAKQTIETLEHAETVVTPAASCAIAIRHDYPTLLADDPGWHARAARLADRTYDLVTFLTVHGYEPVAASAQGVTVHHFCQSTNVAGLGDAMDNLVCEVAGASTRPLRDANVCCGFGGSTSVVAPEVSSAILDKKIAAVRESGAKILVTDNPGCVLHMRGGIAAQGADIETLHVAEFLARHLPG